MQKIYIVMPGILLLFISLLAVLIKGQSILVRKKILPAIFLISLTAAVSCKSSAFDDFERLKSYCWIDENTYRYIATGIPDSRSLNEKEKKESARKNAILNVQYEIISKFKGYVYESCGGMIDFEPSSVVTGIEIIKAVRSGKVIDERYDADFNCEILYEVKSEKLKKKVESRPQYTDYK